MLPIKLLLARIIHDRWIMRAILMRCLDKPVNAQEHPEFWFQLLPGIQPEYAEVCRELGGLAPKVRGFGE